MKFLHSMKEVMTVALERHKNNVDDMNWDELLDVHSLILIFDNMDPAKAEELDYAIQAAKTGEMLDDVTSRARILLAAAQEVVAK